MILWRSIEIFHFFHFNSNPRFPPFLLYVRWKSGVTFVRRCFRDGYLQWWPDRSRQFNIQCASSGRKKIDYFTGLLFWPHSCSKCPFNCSFFGGRPKATFSLAYLVHNLTPSVEDEIILHWPKTTSSANDLVQNFQWQTSRPFQCPRSMACHIQPFQWYVCIFKIWWQTTFDRFINNLCGIPNSENVSKIGTFLSVFTVRWHSSLQYSYT